MGPCPVIRLCWDVISVENRSYHCCHRNSSSSYKLILHWLHDCVEGDAVFIDIIFALSKMLWHELFGQRLRDPVCSYESCVVSSFDITIRNIRYRICNIAHYSLSFGQCSYWHREMTCTNIAPILPWLRHVASRDKIVNGTCNGLLLDSAEPHYLNKCWLIINGVLRPSSYENVYQWQNVPYRYTYEFMLHIAGAK